MNEGNGKKILNERWKTALPGMLLTAVYGLGFAFPDSFWGLHYPSFLPSGLGHLLLILALCASFWPLLAPNAIAIPENGPSKRAKVLLILALAGAYGWLFSSLPIAAHCYGDAQFVYQTLNGEVTQWDSGMLREIFRPSATDLKTGIGAYYGLVSLLAYIFSVNATVAAVWVDTAFGMAFLVLWLSMADRFFKLPSAKVAFGLLGLGAPFLQVFFGHYEAYAVPITLNLAYFYLLLLVFETRRRRTFWAAAVLAYFAMKFQFSNLILLPSLVMAGVFTYGKAGAKSRLLGWKGAFVLFVVPICILGSIVYFFITQSALGHRQFNEETIAEVVFLPLRAMESPPLDNYNLLSLNHFFDAFNQLFLLSAAALLLVAVAAWLHPPKIDWKSPAAVALGMTLGLYLLAFFVFNPLMSMPIDWDLMSIPAPALLVFAVALWRKVEDNGLFTRLLGPILGLSLLSMAAWWVNADPAALSARLESAGYHGFKTYRIGMSTTFEQALELEADSSRVPVRLQGILDRLEPAAVAGNDTEYAALLLRMGKWLEKQEKDLPRAVIYYDRAVEYSPLYAEGVYASVIGHFLLGEFEKAAENLPNLVKLRFPDRNKALRIAVHTSLEAAQYPQAQEYCRQYLEFYPEDTFIREIHAALQAGKMLGELKFRFRRG